MNINRTAVAVVVVLAVVAGYGLYRLGLDRGAQTSAASVAAPAMPMPVTAPAGGGSEAAVGRKVLYWHDPMVPGQKFDKPGKSPFMDMDLVPVYAEEGGDQGSVAISARMQQNLGVRTAEVTRHALTPTVEAVGTVAYNERDVAVVQARSNGFVERLFVRAALDPVRQGQPLAELYVPDWVAAQEEYLSVSRMADAGALLDGARQRMRLAGMSDAQIRSVAASGKVQARFTVTAPIGGVVAELGAREGMTVAAGAPLFRINGLSTVWVNAEVPESLAAQVRPGSAVEARTPALGGTTFKGKVTAILPEVNPVTRTLKVRVELANPGSALVPGMFATVMLKPVARTEMLQVPSEAVITTGKRSVVVVALGDGRFAPVDVEIGMESAGQTEIRKGARGRAAGRGLRTVPDRLGSQPQGCHRAHGRGTGRCACATRGAGSANGARSQHDGKGGAMIARVIRWSIVNRFLVLAGRAHDHVLGIVGDVANPAGCDSRPFRRAGDHPHDAARPGAADRREPGDVSARHDDAVGAGRQGGARILHVRRFVRLHPVRGRHRSILGALARAGIPEPGAVATAGCEPGPRSAPMRRAWAGYTNMRSSTEAARWTCRNCARCRTGSSSTS